MAKYNVKDSVFTHLFREPKYSEELYHELHPEDTNVTEKDIHIVTLENVFLNQPYNDLGFTVGDRLLILVEAQTTWTVNILVRMLLYAAQTIQTEIIEGKQNVYRSAKLHICKPEFYVLYTGDQKDKPRELTLSKEFFKGEDTDLNIRVHMLYGTEDAAGIISQYVKFTEVYSEQLRQYGRTQEAVLETIRICKEQNVLKEYLSTREKEVVDIMMTLFNYETALDLYVHDEKQESEEKGRMNQARSTALNLHRMGMEESKIAAALGVAVEKVRQWLPDPISA